MATNYLNRSDATAAGAMDYMVQTYALAKGLGRLKSDLVLAKLVTNYSQEAQNQGSLYGQSVRVPIRGAVSVTDKTPGSATTPVALTQTKADITINTHKIVDWVFEDYGTLFAQADTMAGYVEDALSAIAEEVDSDIWALYPSASLQKGTPEGGLTDAVVRDVRSSARNTTQKFQLSQPMFFVIGPEAEEDGLGIDRFALVNESGTNAALEGARLGKKYGFDFYTSNLAPAVSGSPSAEHALVFQRDAIGIAWVDMNLSRIPMAYADDMRVMSITDDDGVSSYQARVSISRDYNNVGTRLQIDTIYGVGAVRSAHLIDVRI